ncbi:hypothetical protein ZWY2020_041528 [Hordeum vulgare]|nr:hypothetical protein ZWY2020_041528 [Hordeum vulgare]
MKMPPAASMPWSSRSSSFACTPWRRRCEDATGHEQAVLCVHAHCREDAIGREDVVIRKLVVVSVHAAAMKMPPDVVVLEIVVLCVHAVEPPL